MSTQPTSRNRTTVPGESKMYQGNNRGKRSLVVDVQHSDGLAIIQLLMPSVDVVVSNYNGQSWPKDINDELEQRLRAGKIGLVIIHAANNAFLEWPAFNDMIGLGWRDKSFGPGIAIGPGGALVSVLQGAGLNPGHGPRHEQWRRRVINRVRCMR